MHSCGIYFYNFFDKYRVLFKEVASNHGSFSRSAQALDFLLFLARSPVAVLSFRPLALRHKTTIIDSKITSPIIIWPFYSLIYILRYGLLTKWVPHDPKTRQFGVFVGYTLLPLRIPLCASVIFVWCGSLAVDSHSGDSYEHKLTWVEERLLYLSTVYAINICAYAVMSNHLNVVVYVDLDKAQAWSDKQVISLWHTLYKGTLITQKRMREDALSSGKEVTLQDTIKSYRSRLHNINWFMRNLNEFIAREANKEDSCTGISYSLPSMALTLRAS